jgi:hypothetical protein
MELLFELLFQLLGELLLQLFAEALFELGLRSIAEPFRIKPNPWLAAVGYIVLGGAAGGLSLLVFPHAFIASDFGRLVNLGITPVLAGSAMAALGAWRRSHDQELIRIDRFAYGYLFAIAMAFVRFHFGS